MSFPFEQYDASVATQDKIPCEYGIDFDAGQLTGKKVYGLDAIKVWIWMALNTPRYRYVIYSWDHGQEFDDLIGKNYTLEYIHTEMPRMIEECLTVNPYITGVTNYNFIMDSDQLTGSFTVNTIYGEVIMNV